MEILAILHAAAARDDDLGRGELRPVGLREVLALIGREAGIGRRGHLLDRRRAALSRRLEGRGAHRDELLLVARLHRLHGIAGIDEAHEGIGRLHFGDVGDLHDVEQRGGARHVVLAVGGGGRDDMIIGPGERHDERRHRLGERALILRRIDMQDLLHALELRRLRGGAVGLVAGDEHMHVAAELERPRSAPCGSRP